mgnify:CR=1 FL=1
MASQEPQKDTPGSPGEAPNIVDVQLLVQFDIKDLESYLYKSVDPAGATIVDATETALRQVVGSRPIDDVLTDGKEDIQAETKLALQGLMDDDEIIAEACAIGGDHNGARFENLLMEGENIHWRRSRSGQLTLLSN